MRIPVSLAGAGLAMASIFNFSALAGTIAGHSTANLWGRQMAYTTWNVDGDGMGLNGGESYSTDLVAYNGKLFVANSAMAVYGPGYAYATGASGDLSTPFAKPSTGLTRDDDRIGVVRSLAINTSGSGLGAFSGSEPTLVGFGRGTSPTDNAYVFRDQGAAYAASRATTNIVPRAFDFVPSLGKFATIARVATPATNRVSFWSHDASGLSAAPDRSFEFTWMGGTGSGSYGISMSVISGSLASFLTGVSIAQTQVLLIAGAPREQWGYPEDLTLAVFDMDGNRLGSGTVVPTIGVDNVKAIAVDEQNGLLYVGGYNDGTGGSISVITIPTPGTLALCAITGALAARRRR